MFNNGEIIVSFVLNKELNVIEVVKRIPSNMMYACNPPKPVPDTVYKEIYGQLSDGKLGLIKKIKGEHIPANTINEQIKF